MEGRRNSIPPDYYENTRAVRDIRINLLRRGANDLADPQFLDLGCGLDHSNERHPNERNFSPDLCNQAHRSGWNVTGVDFGSLRRSVPWSFKSKDVMDLEKSDFPVLFDWINSMKLFSVRAPNFISPGLTLPSGFKPYEELRKTIDLLHPEYLFHVRQFFTLVHSILREGGVFTLNDRDIYVKRDGEFVHWTPTPGKVLDVSLGKVIQ